VNYMGISRQVWRFRKSTAALITDLLWRLPSP
jgi:hypothetical protein